MILHAPVDSSPARTSRGPSSSIAQYAEKHFGCQHTQTYDLLRVAAALRELPPPSRRSRASLRGGPRGRPLRGARPLRPFAAPPLLAA
ncbi:MAG: hypothetical protein HY717_00445, partial [Planctomycetes bacterium]|nr:hypothetical protein [Planctomycetota bacterium]